MIERDRRRRAAAGAGGQSLAAALLAARPRARCADSPAGQRRAASTAGSASARSAACVVDGPRRCARASRRSRRGCASRPRCVERGERPERDQDASGGRSVVGPGGAGRARHELAAHPALARALADAGDLLERGKVAVGPPAAAARTRRTSRPRSGTARSRARRAPTAPAGDRTARRAAPRSGRGGGAGARARAGRRRGRDGAGVGRCGGAGDRALGAREVGAADTGGLARGKDVGHGRALVGVAVDGALRGQRAAQRARELDDGHEAVRGADGVDRQRARPPAVGAPGAVARRERDRLDDLVAVGSDDDVAPEQLDAGERAAVAAVLAQAPGVAAGDRCLAQPVAAARGLGDRDDRGAGAAQLTRRPGAGRARRRRARRAARRRRPGPWRAPAPRRR